MQENVTSFGLAKFPHWFLSITDAPRRSVDVTVSAVLRGPSLTRLFPGSLHMAGTMVGCTPVAHTCNTQADMAVKTVKKEKKKREKTWRLCKTPQVGFHLVLVEHDFCVDLTSLTCFKKERKIHASCSQGLKASYWVAQQKVTGIKRMKNVFSFSC